MPDETEAPLTPAQSRIWHLEAEGRPQLVTTARRVTGPLDAVALAEALSTVVGRHDAFRLAFGTGPDGPRQRLAAARDVLERAELSEPAARRWTDEILKRPFAFDEPPGFRVGLARLARDEHLLVFCAHQLVCDAASLALARQEILTVYRSLLAGAEPGLPPAGSFLGYARRAAQDTGRLAAARDYWRRNLSGAPSPVTLPPDHHGPTGPWGDRVTVPLAQRLPAAVAAAARRHRCTTFVLVHAAVAVALGRRCGQSTVVVGTPVDTREEPEHEQTVGMFTNLLALRLTVAAGTPVRQLLADARKAVFGGLSHRHLPVDGIGPRPPFRVLVISDPAYPETAAPQGLRIEPAYKPSPAAHFDLTVLYASQPPKLYADSPAGRHEPSTVESFLREVARVLEGLTADG